ncbi:MAG: glycerophosphodiester phosphodiesterase family protein [Clostridia bacterium]|nr:glycerophosphodiester phosphodiesterase family protein [Clostridia bacterium]
MSDCNIITHRGANKLAPQNTLEAFKIAMQYKPEGYETDVHLTKDGIPVICHDYTVNKTSNGEGNIRDMTLAELRELDFGSYFHSTYKGTRIPTLDEFLNLMKKADFKILDIEIKSPLDKDYSIVPIVVDAVKAHGLFDKLLISSFDSEVLIKVKEYDENCLTGFLYSPKQVDLKIWKKPVDYAKSIGADALHPYYGFVDRKYVEKAHENDIEVNPWTVNKEKHIRNLALYGVDGIITDFAKFAKEIVGGIL